VQDPLLLVIRRADCEPPVFLAGEAKRDLEPSLAHLLRLGLLREAAHAPAHPCPQCYGPVSEEVEVYRDARTEQSRMLLFCATCGANEVTTEGLRRWEVDLPRFLEAVSRAAGVRGRPQELVPRRLWRLGTAAWAQRPREVYFGRNLYGEARDAAVAKLARHAKAVLILPTEAAADRWGSAPPQLSVALDSTLEFDHSSLCFDVSFVESRLADQTQSSATNETRPVRRRSGRATDIDKLIGELKKHLGAARDYAHSTKAATGIPKLLPRPTKQELGRMVGITPCRVTRSFKDTSEPARVLDYLWNKASDLDQVMEWKDRPRRR